MNRHEAERVAAAIHQIRPDWPASSLLTLIGKRLADKPQRDVLVALAWVACEPATAKPARVLEAGPWWRAVAVGGGTRPTRPYDAHEFCAVCQQPLARHVLVDHEPVSAAEHAANVAARRAPTAIRQMVASARPDRSPTDPSPTPTTNGAHAAAEETR